MIRYRLVVIVEIGYTRVAIVICRRYGTVADQAPHLVFVINHFLSATEVSHQHEERGARCVCERCGSES